MISFHLSAIFSHLWNSLSTRIESSCVQITQSRVADIKNIKHWKNDEINWIRAYILIFIIVPVQTYLSHLPRTMKACDEWTEKKRVRIYRMSPIFSVMLVENCNRDGKTLHLITSRMNAETTPAHLYNSASDWRSVTLGLHISRRILLLRSLHCCTTWRTCFVYIICLCQQKMS